MKSTPSQGKKSPEVRTVALAVIPVKPGITDFFQQKEKAHQ
jgi:hypothetical protein